MSYSLLNSCYSCVKKDTCKDAEKIQKAIYEIHGTTYDEGHQGSGTIAIVCNRQESNW